MDITDIDLFDQKSWTWLVIENLNILTENLFLLLWQSHDSLQGHLSEISREFDLTTFFKFYSSRIGGQFFFYRDQSFVDKV